MADSKGIYDVATIGSGPAGYSAALQTAKEGLSTFVFQGFEMGGQLMLYSEIEDYPGVEESISGPDLAERFERQALACVLTMKSFAMGFISIAKLSRLPSSLVLRRSF